ncbi:MAG: adenylate kinase family protein [Methanomassiliicoccaceae archaeon]|jgi:adenylate kinase|nr:adenylate kinase family protein [Methanomassiliicoccaceae archaeon]
MIVAITGTPGTGKTAIASCLRKNGEYVIDLNDYIEENGLKERFDRKRDTYNVDVNRLNESLKTTAPKDRNVFLDGHLSHFLDCDTIIVIRCNPSVLHDRLKKRNYAYPKIIENVQAEALDVILCESTGSKAHVFEMDNTSCTTEQATLMVMDIVNGNTETYRPGSVNWSEEMERWC